MSPFDTFHTSRPLADEETSPKKEVVRVALGGFLHDLGEAGIQNAIPNEKDKFTDEKYTIVEIHSDVGWSSAFCPGRKLRS